MRSYDLMNFGGFDVVRDESFIFLRLNLFFFIYLNVDKEFIKVEANPNQSISWVSNCFHLFHLLFELLAEEYIPHTLPFHSKSIRVP